MIIEGKHADLGRGVFVSDIQEGSAADCAGLSVGDMILCVNHTDLIGSDYETVSAWRCLAMNMTNRFGFLSFFFSFDNSQAANALKCAEGLLTLVIAKPGKTNQELSSSMTVNNSASRPSSLGAPLSANSYHPGKVLLDVITFPLEFSSERMLCLTIPFALFRSFVCL